MFGRYKYPQLEAPPIWWGMLDNLRRLEKMRAQQINSALLGGFDYELAREWADEEYGGDIKFLEGEISKAKGQ